MKRRREKEVKRMMDSGHKNPALKSKHFIGCFSANRKLVSCCTLQYLLKK
jgi:hypothetical protein